MRPKVLVLVLFLVSLTILYLITQKGIIVFIGSGNTLQLQRQPCNNLLSTESGGRFGNQMSEYATLLGHSRRLGVKPVIPNFMSDILKSVFPNLTIPSMDRLHCDQKIEKRFVTLNKSVLYDFEDSDQLFRFANNDNNLVQLPKFSNDFHMYSLYDKEIREEYRFNDQLERDSHNFLRTIKSNHLKSNPLSDETTFIGLHVRRTDYNDWLRRCCNGTLVTEKFFKNAMNHFRNEFQRSADEKTTIFIVASDDLNWCKQKFNQLPDVYFVNKDNTAEIDLAILSHCNHSIIDYGTFGFWGAFLANGITLRAKNYGENPKYSKWIEKNFPNWIHIDAE